ncbi:hypothetical protein [Flavobacterium lindanitolerans]|uniref:Uncharacterized protein n=1 Tax=Flavobacterium lindanitolerans TaxID=428988 RepID=A0A497V1Z6_9FLAO|nr:hypothetical protein [Flavobacterium lindanitolerans]PKW29761.1 hypothetical protein B0G92_1406 [Flavobacterium lindanitolerans]RLJ34738.1 hypothetical protein CLV50_0098 [Flavobacterium lindanitolerans]
MENFRNLDLKKSEQKTNRFVSLMGVKTIVVTLFLTALMVGCSKDDQQETENTPDTAARIYYDYFIVRAWGAHNVDCSQPDGFCHEIWRITWRNLIMPLPNGDTPVGAQNVDGLFVMKIYKSALTEEHGSVLLRDGGYYTIPKGQTIPKEVAKSLGFRSDKLREGRYKIKGNDEFYTISIPIAEN